MDTPLDEFINDAEYQKLKKQKQNLFEKDLNNGVNLVDQSNQVAKITEIFNLIQQQHNIMKQQFYQFEKRSPKRLERIEKIIQKVNKRVVEYEKQQQQQKEEEEDEDKYVELRDFLKVKPKPSEKLFVITKVKPEFDLNN